MAIAGQERRETHRFGPNHRWTVLGIGDAATAAGVRSPLVRWDIWRLAPAGALLTVPQFGILTFSAVFLHDAKGVGVPATVVMLMVVQIGGGAARI
ncbi:hypothetical protein ACQPZF_26810 [Actinosynnema sp. CS-041913]|uniref:hypothetical protein n=1 Tax=Actinosynnema sp. CS-041913 TaxID=3239917 RepID=UPI003D8A1704